MAEKQLNIHQRLLGIMADIDYIQKGPKTVNGQYRYASHDQVTAALHPLFVKHGVLPIPTTEDMKQEGNRTSILLGVAFTNVDQPQDHVYVRFPGFGVDPGDKGPGKAISYAFKMACLKTFCLETGEDPDQDAKAVYKASKCPEFDLALPDHISCNDPKLKAFLKSSAEIMGKDIEDVKREALGKMPKFLEALQNWKPKKGEKE
jgi:hypothetical protein